MTPRQERFVAEYLVDLNATQAAIRAGYSTKTAASIGYENLRKPEISAFVQATVQRHMAALDLSLERIIAEAARVGISDIRDLFDPETHAILEPHKLPENVARAVASFTVTTSTVSNTITEVKFWNKLQALELVAKLKSLINQKLTVDAGISWEQILVAMHAERAKAKARLGGADL